MNSRMWNELKFQVQQLELTCMERCENSLSPLEDLRWDAQMSMANLILRSMEDLERNSGQRGLEDDVVVGDVGGTGLGASADDVAGHGEDLARDTDAT